MPDALTDDLVDDVELVGRLIAHILEHHSGDGAAKERTVALVMEHLHWRKQKGLREAASLVHRLSKAPKHPEAARALKVAANAIDELVARNDATHERFGE